MDDLYASLRACAADTPCTYSRTLYIAGQHCGYVTLAAADALQNHPGIIFQEGALHIGKSLTPGEMLDALMADIAQTLRAADCLRGWRDERLAVITAQGEYLGAIERAATRPLGLLTQAVHLNAWTPDGRLWVAQRAYNKTTDPGMWDTLVGGLVAHQETLNDALLRECYEEAGLTPQPIQTRSPLRHLLRLQRRLSEGYQVEDLFVSHCVLDASVSLFNRDGEVIAITTFSPEQVLQMIAMGEFTLEASLVILDGIAQKNSRTVKNLAK